MPATFTSYPSLDQIAALLDRLDPELDSACDVAGCIHHHSHHQPHLSVVGVGTV